MDRYDLVSKLTRHQKAKLAETAVLNRLILHGLRVFQPNSDWDTADLVVISPSEALFKIQVKSVRQKLHGSPNVKLTRERNMKGGIGYKAKYKQGDFDFLVGYDGFTDVAYVWSWDEVKDYASSIAISESSIERWDKMGILS